MVSSVVRAHGDHRREALLIDRRRRSNAKIRIPAWVPDILDRRLDVVSNRKILRLARRPQWRLDLAAFLVVARLAGSDDVRPGVRAAVGARYDVIYREQARVESLTTVSALVQISEEKIIASKRHTSLPLAVPLVSHDNGRHPDCQPSRVNCPVVVPLEHLGLV